MMIRAFLPALAIACAVAAPAVAEPLRMEVRYGDLDLTKDAGRQALEERVDRAVRKVCGDAPARDLRQMAARRECLAQTRDTARGQVELALNAANARRVAVLANKLYIAARF